MIIGVLNFIGSRMGFRDWCGDWDFVETVEVSSSFSSVLLSGLKRFEVVIEEDAGVVCLTFILERSAPSWKRSFVLYVVLVPGVKKASFMCLIGVVGLADLCIMI